MESEDITTDTGFTISDFIDESKSSLTRITSYNVCYTKLLREHFDGLVHGINELIARIEQSDRQIYEAELFLQEAEIKKQKAYIVSLKKQINAHFTVNVLTVIKALRNNFV